jgi:hypothetical protein
MSQTAYTATMTAAFVGMIADITESEIETYANGEASAEIGFGFGVKQKTGAGTDEQAILPTAQGDALVGVVTHSHAYAVGGNLPELGTVGIKPLVPMNVMREGRVWVQLQSGVSVSKGDRAHYNWNDKTWRNSASGTDTIDCTAQAVFRSTAAAGGIALLEVDFINKP